MSLQVCDPLVPDLLQRPHSRLLRPCYPDDFRCVDNDECVPRERVCDAVADCMDGSDESDTACREYRDAHVCVQGTDLCDKERVDLLNPTTACDPPRFRCSDSGKCLNDLLRCDGVQNCRDGSDERDCPVVGEHVALTKTSIL